MEMLLQAPANFPFIHGSPDNRPMQARKKAAAGHREGYPAKTSARHKDIF